MPDPLPSASVPERLERLREDIAAQGRRVLDVVLLAVEAYFDADRAKAEGVVAADD
ncbi:MAG: hypothetical protein RLZZ565_582, partial [Planctomycetota bacterium]